ncbi:glycosyl transferase group 1 [Ancylobacter novellus DSM 506]|uniref:Glycosyl transferase group 1 n=1 Tax=Ancylobacter novellus (strain ATCC 8093 / DSM 506 / JCM 20403 / CCM 1077 / IAM 12100 / NBRC 12443 / NCIMB 10456) TaxID=639283 RepID=D7A825_ANCN5|nr:glycosyltransferase family 4 protein [Ancylobacter novellus]ADH90483.1 glycosyl transferase group 1 [Ancylobacter novellus DSM 506]
MSDPTTDKARPRLILLKQWFDPEQTIKGLTFARRLQELGFDVEVVTGFPNYPGGKIFPGYRIRPIQRELMNGICVSRLALYPSHDASRIGRVLNYVSFFLSATLYLVFVARRADVIYVYHPPLTVAMAAAITRRLRRIPIVIDVQDMWPDTLRATGMIGSERLLRVVGAVCRWIWCQADRITVLSDGFRRLLIERGVPPEKIAVIPNWSEEETEQASADKRPEAFRDTSKFRVLFAGNMGAAQALSSVLDAAALVGADHPRIEFCLLGSGIEMERLKARAARDGLANVRFLPRVTMAEVGAWLKAADVLLVHLKDDPLFAITIPSKTQAYLAAGKPILMAVAGDAAELVRQAGAGLIVPPEDPQALAGAVVQMAGLDPAELATLGANGRVFYERELSFDKGTRAFAAILGELAGRRTGAARS